MIGSGQMNMSYLSREARLVYSEFHGLNHNPSLSEAEEDALEELKEQYSILAIRLQKLGPNDPNIASIFNSIGRQYLRMKEYYKALTHFSAAKDIREKSLGPNHQETIDCYSFVGLCYYMMDDYGNAEYWINRVKTSLYITFGLEHPLYSNASSFRHEIQKKMRNQESGGEYGRSSNIKYMGS